MSNTATTASNRYTVCTSSTHPASPLAGDVIYETDTGNTLTYQSSTTGWTANWNTGWGSMGSGFQSGGDQSTTTTITDVTGAAVTFTAVANRKYQAFATQLSPYSTVAADGVD